MMEFTRPALAHLETNRLHHVHFKQVFFLKIRCYDPLFINGVNSSISMKARQVNRAIVYWSFNQIGLQAINYRCPIMTKFIFRGRPCG